MSREEVRSDPLARLVLESLRLGIVPDAALEEWTVGRTEEFEAIAKWLEDEAEGTLLIEGRYGSGKTHLLRHTAMRARDAGFAVALVRIDPGQENASFPLRFYRSVMRMLEAPIDGAIQDFAHLFSETAKAGRVSSLAKHRFFGPLAQQIASGKVSPKDWSALMGERSKSTLFPTNLDFTTVANLACNLLSSVSHFLAMDAGLRGLLLLVDEVETAEVRRYSYHWKRTLNFLRGRSLASNDDDVLQEGVQKDSTGIRRGERTGLVYSGHYPDVPYYHRFPTRLKVMLALTECRVSGELRSWKEEQQMIVLSDIDRLALMELYRKVTSAYAALHRVRIPRRLERWVQDYLLADAYRSGSMRGFGKALMEVLDFARHHPRQPLESLEGYREF